MELEMMRVAAPHIGVEPCAGAKTDVMGFPRVVVECLLALAQHTRGRTAIEIVNLHEVGKAVAGEPPRALHADGPADAGLEGLLGLRQAVGTHETPFVLGRPSRTARHQHVHVVVHLAETADRQTKDGAELNQTSLDRALSSGLRAAPPSVERLGFFVVHVLDEAHTLVGRVTAYQGALLVLVSAARTNTFDAHREGLQFDQPPGSAVCGSGDEEVRAQPLPLKFGLGLLPALL